MKGKQDRNIQGTNTLLIGSKARHDQYAYIVQCYVPGDMVNPVRWSHHLTKRKARQVQAFVLELLSNNEETV